MNISEYKQQRDEIELNAKKYKNNLMRSFALSNNNIKIGDIVTDINGKGLVEHINVSAGYFNNDTPECVYGCLELTLKGLKKKKSIMRDIYQSNLK